jgi:archaellum component FlaC
MAKEITIEDLARMVQQGFSETAGRIDKLEANMYDRFQNVNDKLEKVDKRFDEVGHKINQIDRRLFSIEDDVSEIKTRQYRGLDGRLNVVERKLGIEGVR